MHKPEHDSLSRLFICVAKLHHNKAHTILGKLGLFPGQPAILFSLWEQDGRTQKELSDRLMNAPATITVILQRMEKAGFIERRSDPDDLRILRVYLTKKGHDIRADVESAFSDLQDKCFVGFTPEEKLLLHRFFLRMKDNLDHHDRRPL